jgi:predicted RNA-binding protein with PIN domain
MSPAGREDGLDLTGAEAEELLHPAAELAIEIARTNARGQPPLEVPGRLRPFLGFAKLTNRALATARRVVEEDSEFRSHVARAVDMPNAERTLGRAGILWLSRPDGWEAELGALVAEARSAAAARAEDVEERSAQRRLRHAEEARDRAERGADDARRSAEAARADLQEERRLRRSAEEVAQRAARHASSVEEQLAAARRAADQSAAQLAERAEAHAATTAALAEADAERRDLRAQVDRLRTIAERTVATPATPPPSAQAQEPAVAADQRGLADAVTAASAAAAALGAALSQAAAALEPRSAPRPTMEVAEAPPAAPHARRPATPPRWNRRRRRGPPRRPAPLPPFVHDDSTEAAEHLVRLPGVTLLVDGYNATISTWPELPLPEQRRRLVDALAELAARTGASPEVVFDGAEVAPEHRAPVPLRSLVNVSFTSPDVEADDELIARARARRLPVVVASNDRRVREGARAAGANVLGIDQLLAALRRQGA